MGLESAPQNPLGRIDVSALAPQASPVVEPRAVMALNEAYRQGLITANDIHDRMVQKPVVEGQAKVMGSPEVLAAQKQMILGQPMAQHADLVLKMAQAHAALQKSPVPELLKNQIDELGKAGEVILPVNGQTYTSDDYGPVQAKWQDLQNYHTQVAANKAERELLKDQTFKGPNGAESVASKATGSQRLADPSAVAAAEDWAVANPSFTAWQKNGRQVPTRIFPAPGQASAPVDTVTPTAAPVAPDIAAPAPAAPASSVFTPGSQPTSLPGLQTGIASPDAGVKRTEVQDRAALALTRFNTSAPIFEKLKKEGFDPATAMNSFQSAAFVGPLEGAKSEQLKEYESAQLPWLQGVLRMESGAAISRDEERKYARAFFPRFGDSPAVQAQKATLRATVEQTMGQIAAGKPFDANDQKTLSIARAKADVLGAVADSLPAPTRTVNVSGLGQVTLQQDANGRTRIVYPNQSAQPSSASSYVPPATLNAGSKPAVEPKRKGGAPIQDAPMPSLPEVKPKSEPSASDDEIKTVARNLRRGFRKVESDQN